jgi:hypothetical protein
VSDTSQGQGWWQASDLKWYPPEAHPNHGAAPQVAAAEPQWRPNEAASEPAVARGPQHAMVEDVEVDDEKEFDARIPLLVFLILFFVAVGVSAWIISLHS